MELRLQLLNGESLNTCSAITTDDARLDIRARCFWSSAQDAYFEVWVFHPHAMSNASGPITAVYRKQEAIKKRAYGQRVRDIEHRVFTPLVFSTTGEMGPEAPTFYKRLAGMITWKENKPYSVVISWLRCKLLFAAVRFAFYALMIQDYQYTSHDGMKTSPSLPVR